MYRERQLLRPVWIVTIAWACVTAARAADQPTIGVLSNIRERSGLAYICRAVGADEIACDFTKTSVRREVDPKDLDKVLQEARALFAKNPERPDENECK